MLLKPTLCAAAILAITAPALAQDVAAALSAFYNQAVEAQAKANAGVEASGKAFTSGDAASGCTQLRTARTTYGESRVAMEGLRELLGAGKDLTPDYQKQGLDWLNQNEPVVDDSMKQVDRIIDSECDDSSSSSNTGAIDALLDQAAASMNRGFAANREAREAFGNDDLVNACSALEAARQNHSDGYQDLSQARSMVQSNHDLPPSVQRQYFDAIDRTQSAAEDLATSMSELWRNRCSSR